jgi:hypothetical protein
MRMPREIQTFQNVLQENRSNCWAEIDFDTASVNVHFGFNNLLPGVFRANFKAVQEHPIEAARCIASQIDDACRKLEEMQCQTIESPSR